jgi:hypothetical protein
MDLELGTQLLTIVGVTSLLAAMGGFVYDVLFPVGVAESGKQRFDNRIFFPHRVDGGFDLGFLGPVLVGIVAGNATIFAVAFKTDADGVATVSLSTLVWMSLIAGVAGAAVLDSLRERLIASLEGREEDSRNDRITAFMPMIQGEVRLRFPELAEDFCEGRRSLEEATSLFEKSIYAVLGNTRRSDDQGIVAARRRRSLLRFATAVVLFIILLVGVVSAEPSAERNTGGPDAVMTLSVRTRGSGLVRIAPSGAECPPNCTFDAAQGKELTLKAKPAEGFKFAGWSGACQGGERCRLTMNEDESVTATFERLQTASVQLTIKIEESGLVRIAPSGAECPPTCTFDAARGDDLTLTAEPAEGFIFAGWFGACQGTENCRLTMNEDESVTATFERIRVTTTTSVPSTTAVPSTTSVPPID